MRAKDSCSGSGVSNKDALLLHKFWARPLHSQVDPDTFAYAYNTLRPK